MQYCTWKQGYTTSFYYSSFITKSKTIPSIIWAAVCRLFMYHSVEQLLRKTTCDLPTAELWEDCLWQLASLRGPFEFLMMGKSLLQHNLYKKKKKTICRKMLNSYKNCIWKIAQKVFLHCRILCTSYQPLPILRNIGRWTADRNTQDRWRWEAQHAATPREKSK